MYNPPYFYKALNANGSETPQAFIHIHNTGVSRLFKRYLLQDMLSVFKWTVPKNWDKDYFRYALYGFGFVAVFKTDLFGVIPQQCTFSGQNVFYRPTRALVANPLIESRDLLINKDCVIIRMQPDYGGIIDLVDYYGDLMALTAESLSGNILNSRLAYLIGVEGKAEADKFKAIFDDVLSGKPAVVYRKEKAAGANLSGKLAGDDWQLLIQNLKQTFITPDLIDALNAIRDEYLTVIGIPNLSVRKKERVNTIDSERNTVETQTKADLWLEEMQEGIDAAKAMFGLEDLAVEKRYKDLEGGSVDAGAVDDNRTIQL